MALSRKTMTYDEVIGYDSDGNAVILLYTFDHGDGFKGATGAILELVSQEEYDYRTSDEALQEYAEELWREDAGSPNGTTDSPEDWTEANREDLIQGVFDDSYSGLIVTWVRPDLADVIYEAEK